MMAPFVTEKMENANACNYVYIVAGLAMGHHERRWSTVVVEGISSSCFGGRKPLSFGRKAEDLQQT